MNARRKKKSPSQRPSADPPKASSPLAVSQGIRPWLLGGMTALLVSRTLYPSESAVTHGDGLSAVMFWIALAVFWLLSVVNKPKFPIRFRWIDAAVVLLLIFYGLSTLKAVDIGSPRPAINHFWEWLALGLCFLMARQLIDTPREARAMAAVMISLAVALSVYGLYQREIELPASLANYRADPDRALRDAGLWYPPDSPQRKLFEDRLAGDEPMATFALTNSLAGFLAPWLVVLAGIAISTVGGDSSRRSINDDQSIGDRSRLLQYRYLQRLWISLGLMIPIVFSLFFTHSRSGCFAALLGFAFVWPIVRGKGWKIPLTILLVGAALVASAAALGKIDRETAVKSFGYRLQYWRSSLEIIADHPWLGCGPGNFKETYTQYKLPEASEEIADPHNFFFEIWSNAGTPAALAFLAVLGFFAWNIRGRGPGTRDQKEERGERREERKNKTNPSNPQSLIPNPQPPTPQPHSWRFILAGGAFGFVLAVPLGMLSEAPPNIAAFLLGLPLAAFSAVLLFDWIRNGRLPRLLPALAVAVLLVNLLAAGGISLSSVAGSFWLLMVLGLQGEQPRMVRSIWGWAALAVMFALAVACYYTAYSPVLACQAQLQAAERAPSRAVDHLKAAAAADPWATEPWRRLAAVELENWLRHPTNETYRQFERAAANLARLAPNASQTWENIGDWYSLAALKTDRSGKRHAPGAVERMIDSYRRAVELYPNSATIRAKLAEAYLKSGDRAAYRREAAVALELDEATPHVDKKLPEKVRKRLSSEVNDR